MGKGKGEPEFWAAVVKPGMILYEIAGVPEERRLRDCLARVAYKMPFRCKLVADAGPTSDLGDGQRAFRWVHSCECFPCWF